MIDHDTRIREELKTIFDDLAREVARDAMDLEPEWKSKKPLLARRSIGRTYVLLGSQDPKIGDDDLIRERLLLQWREKISNPKPFVRRVNSIEEFAKFLEKYGSINRLLLVFHTDGHADMTIGDEHLSIDGERVRKVLASARAQVKYVEFSSCLVGFRPDRMAAFGRLLNAETVVGWTAWRVVNLEKLSLSRGDLRNVLKAVNDYLAVGGPTMDDVLNMKKKGYKNIPLVLEGFLRGANPPDWKVERFKIPGLKSKDPIGEFWRATGKFVPRSKVVEQTLDGTTIGISRAPSAKDLRKPVCRVEVRLPRR